MSDNLKPMLDANELVFWKKLSLSLKDELIERGNRIAELESQLALVSRALTNTDNADRYYKGFNDGYDHAAAELEAAHVWEPIPDGELAPRVELRNRTIFFQCTFNEFVMHGYTLQDGEYLVRRKPAEDAP